MNDGLFSQQLKTIKNNNMVDLQDEIQLTKWANVVYDIIGAAMEVHTTLGFGLSEGVYEESLGIELGELGYEYMTQCDLPTYYKGILLDKHFRLDMVVEDDIVIELKAVEKVLPEHRAQLFNYLRLTKKPVGVLINFGKSLYSEKYIYDEDANTVTFFNIKHTRGAYSLDDFE